MNWHHSAGVFLEQSWIFVLNHLWQSTICFALAWGFTFLLKKSHPKFRLTLWLFTFVKFVVPTILFLTAFQRFGFDPLIYIRPQTAGYSNPTQQLILLATQPMTPAVDAMKLMEASSFSASQKEIEHRELFCVLSVLWFGGVAFLISRWTLARMRLQRMLKSAAIPLPENLSKRVEEIRGWLSIKKNVSVTVLSQNIEPGVWGIRKPIIILPSSIIEQLNQDELDTILMHELAHVAQRDNLQSFIQRLLCLVFWFHPFVWLLNRQLILERELLCDEKVMRWSHQPDNYPASLWKIATLQFDWKVSGISHFTGSNLKMRIERMLKNNHSSWNWKRKFSAVTTVTTMTAVVIGLGIFAPYTKLMAKMQEQQNPTFLKLNFENAPEIPFVITEAEITFTQSKVYLPGKSGSPNPAPRDTRIPIIAAKLKNFSSRLIQGFVLELGDPMESRKNHFLYQVSVNKNGNEAVPADRMLAPQSTTLFAGSIHLPNSEDENLMRAQLRQYTLKVVGVMFDADQDWYWTEATQKEPRPQIQIQEVKRIPSLNSTSTPTDLQLQINLPETSTGNNAAPYSDEIPTATASSKPVITYIEKAEYTPDARAAGIDGTIAVNAIFGSDGNIYGARIIRGLPMGLNEEAMNAVQKIKFKPATKNGENVSVRMTMEFSFSAVKNGK